MKKKLLVILSLWLLSSCDSGPNLSDICQSNEQICQVFAEDSWCKAERSNVILALYKSKESQQDIDKYRLLIAYESYGKCVRFAKKIEHIKLKAKRSLRVENYLKSQLLIKDLSEETKNSQHPSLLFYHWSRYLNQKALKSFLAMEGSAALETPTEQFNLASYYIKHDGKKTLSLLFHALELYQVDEQINEEIFSSLVTILQKNKKAKQAYIWLKVLHLYNPDNDNVTDESLINFAKKYYLKTALLDKVAEQTLDNIQLAKFESPKF